MKNSKFIKISTLGLCVICLVLTLRVRQINAEIEKIDTVLNEHSLTLEELQQIHFEKSQPEEVINETMDAEILAKYLGNFKITAYCACYKCCNKQPTDPGYGITASGTKVEEGRTIAVDPSIIPLGSQVMIDGHIYTAEDTGKHIKGNRIDMYISDHSAAKVFGVQHKDVSLLTEE